MKNLNVSVLSIISLSLVLCGSSAFALGKHRKTDDGENYRLYTIKKGDHYTSTGNRVDIPAWKTSFSYKVIFDDSAKYTTATKDNQEDINKLVGFTDCGSFQPHKESARFGWTWNKNALQIFAYTYVNGKVDYTYLGDAVIGKSMEYSIKPDGSQYIFKFNGHETRMARGCSRKTAFKTTLYPFFGGDETAPHDIKILVRHE